MREKNKKVCECRNEMSVGFSWPPRSYSCSFCKREFRSAQALGGHMNVHRRDRAKLRHHLSPPPSSSSTSDQYPNFLINLNITPTNNPNHHQYHQYHHHHHHHHKIINYGEATTTTTKKREKMKLDLENNMGPVRDSKDHQPAGLDLDLDLDLELRLGYTTN